MAQPKIFISRILPEPGMALIRARYPAFDLWQAELPPSPAELRQHSAGTHGLLCLLTDRIDAALLDAIGPQLRVISSMSVGVDHIDIPAATARGIPVGNTPGVLTDATADQAFALLLAAARRLTEAERFLRAGKWVTWSPSLLLGADLAGATLGIIGFGRIGQAVARRAAGFDLRVLYHTPHSCGSLHGAQPVELETLLRESDFVSLHLPLTPQTHHLVDDAFLARMKPGAIMVNTARGGLLDQDALYRALCSGQLAAAALDVTDPEPLPLSCPLLGLENCLIVPHLGSASHNTRAQMSVLAAQNLLAGLEGQPLPHCVNPEVYDRPNPTL